MVQHAGIVGLMLRECARRAAVSHVVPANPVAARDRSGRLDMAPRHRAHFQLIPAGQAAARMA
jgi:hypothetical protein